MSIIPGFPTPLISSGAASLVQVGFVDITVGDAYNAGVTFGYQQGVFGSKSFDTLLSYDGVPISLTAVSSRTNPDNNIAFAGDDFASTADAQACLDYLQANFSYIQDPSGTNFRYPVSSLYVSNLRIISPFWSGGGPYWNASDENQTFTLGWDY